MRKNKGYYCGNRKTSDVFLFVYCLLIMYNKNLFCKEEYRMGSDCTVEIDEGYINIRVGAIIMKNDKFLMVGNENYDYLYSVGGRIKFG